MPKSANVDAKFGEAIRRRTYPNTALHPKQLAHIAGTSLSTFMRWCRGESRVTGHGLGCLCLFFAQHGDWGFIKETIGLDISARALDARLEKLDRELAELRSDLKGSGDAGLARAREAVVLDRAGRVRGEAGEGAARQEKGAERVAALAGESGR